MGNVTFYKYPNCSICNYFIVTKSIKLCFKTSQLGFEPRSLDKARMLTIYTTGIKYYDNTICYLLVN